MIFCSCARSATDVFDAGKADFPRSPTMPTAFSFTGQALRARVTIDEEGVVAAAYTVMVACGAALPPDERVEFTLDRPFLSPSPARAARSSRGS